MLADARRLKSNARIVLIMTSPTPALTPNTPLYNKYYAAWYDGSEASALDCFTAAQHATNFAWTYIGNIQNSQAYIKKCPPTLPSSPTCVTYTTVVNTWFVVNAVSGNCTSIADGWFQPTFATSAEIDVASGKPLITSVTLQEETGSIALPALLLGGSTSVTVAMSGSFPDLTWIPKRRAIAGASVLSTLTFAETARTVNSITYTVTAGVASLAGVLLVDGYKLTVA
jgi:hypothetical protein